jgi:hypothetical protein
MDDRVIKVMIAGGICGILTGILLIKILNL